MSEKKDVTAPPLHCSTATLLSQGQFMELALQHPDSGYYRTQQAVGQDFTTAPEISQVFGELIGAWVLDIYEQLGSPSQVNLVELGPGRGTLMADLLRVAALSPAFMAALQIHLVEINPFLLQQQKGKIHHSEIYWHETVETLPLQAPLLLIANEFFDAMPTHFYRRQENMLYERFIDLSGEEPVFTFLPLASEEGEDVEWETSPVSLHIMELLSQRLRLQGGVCLLIDYGYESGTGDTLQALFRGEPSPPLSHIGKSDLTCHVNFGALKQVAITQGLSVFGPVSQRTFLKNLGIDLRIAQLQHKNKQEAAVLNVAHARLTHPCQMGTLFKAMAIVSQALIPGGFHE